MHFSKLVKEKDWGNEELAEKYLKKYWLPELEYLSAWKPIQDEIFIEGKSLPDLIYRPEFKMIVANGGCLFVEEDFKQLQKSDAGSWGRTFCNYPTFARFYRWRTNVQNEISSNHNLGRTNKRKLHIGRSFRNVFK